MEARRQNRPANRGLCACAGDYLRWLLCLLLVTALVVLAVLYVIQTRLDEEIRAHLEGKFRDHYSDLLVSVKSARRLPRGGIEVRGLSIAAPNPQGSPTLLAHIDELLVDCDTSLAGLFAEDRKVRQLILRRLLVRPERGADGKWSTSKLLPLPKFGPTPPPARIESGIIAVRDVTAPHPWVLKNVDMQINPMLGPKHVGPQRISAGGGPPADGPPRGEAPPTSRRAGLARQAGMPAFTVSGSFLSDILGRVECQGDLDFSTATWNFEGQVRNLPLTAKVVNQLPPAVAKKLAVLRAFDGLLNIDYRITSRKTSQLPFGFALAGKFAGRIDDVRLPLQNVRVAFRCSEQSLEVESASGRLGESLLQLSGQRAGWEDNSPLRVDLRVERFPMNRSLRSAMPNSWRAVWDRFAPEGLIDANASLGFDGQRWSHNVDIDCRGCSFAYDAFPYRLTNASGRIHFEDTLLSIKQLRAHASERAVRIDGQLQNPRSAATGWITVSANEPIPIDERLLGALKGGEAESGKAGPRAVVASMQPHGKVSATGRFGRDTANVPFQKQLHLRLHDCSVVYDRFRYPIYGINGTLRMENDRWTVERLEGSHDSSVIICKGGWEADGRGGWGLGLEFDAVDVPLQDELRDALTPGAQGIWKQLRPRGTIDRLLVDVGYLSLDRKLDVRVEAHKRAPSQNVVGRSITVEPIWFPYQLDQVRGKFTFENGIARMSNVSARHGPTEIRFHGEMNRSPQAGWKLTLSDLHADRVFATHKLVDALPPVLGGAMSKLKVEGPLGIDGSLQLTGRPGEKSPSSSNWNFSLDLENGRINCGASFEHIHGALKLVGGHGPQGLSGRGEIAVDSVFLKGVQLTGVHGPVTLDQDRIAFGTWASAPATPSPIVARALGGTVAASATISLSERSFRIDAALSEGDLSSISREATVGRHEISGRAYGNIRLAGTSRGVHTLSGQGEIRLKEADIYELPVMIRLLKLLRIHPPDQTAFTSSDLQFRLQGDRIYFDRIDFDGDAISLEGRGEMDFNRVLNLTFDTSVGRDDNQPLSLILRPILKEAGRRLMLIRVTGPIQDPRIERIALPELNEGFQQVFQETPRGTGTATSRLWRSNRAD